MGRDSGRCSREMLPERLESRVLLAGDSLGEVAWSMVLPKGSSSSDFVIGTDGSIIVPGGWAGDCLVTKLDAGGQIAWTRVFGGSSTWESISAVATDAKGNVYAVGYTLSSDLPSASNRLLGTSDGFITKLDPDGQVLWSTYIGEGDEGGAADVVVDVHGDVLVAGSVDDYPGAGTRSEAFVAKVDGSGQVLWKKNVASTWTASAIGTDSSGNAYVTGNTPGEIVAHIDEYTPVYAYDAFVAKISSSGQTVWTSTFGDADIRYSDGGKALAVDGGGNVLVTGYLGYYWNQDSTDHQQAFVRKLSSSGQQLWATGIPGEQEGRTLALDSAGNALVVAVHGTPGFGGRADTLAVVDPSGRAFFGKIGIGDAYAVADLQIGPSGYLLATGDRWLVDASGHRVGRESLIGRLILRRTEEIHGTDLDDIIRVKQVAAGALEVTINGVTGEPFLPGPQIVIRSLDGNDSITIDPSVTVPAVIEAGRGNDTVRAGSGNDTVDGGYGDDMIYGGAGDDLFADSYGRDSLYGGAGNDKAYGGYGEDLLEGGEGNDTLLGGHDSDTLYGHDGADSLFGSYGDDEVYGNAGDDTLNGSFGDDYLAGQTGNDQLMGESGDDTATGGSGMDTISGSSGSDSLSGNDDDDEILGGPEGDWIAGGDANDTLLGGDGGDVIYGGPGADLIEGKGKADTLHGGMGDDTIRGGAGSDLIFGEDGDDTMDAALHSLFRDTINGGAGHDLYRADDDDVLREVEELLV